MKTLPAPTLKALIATKLARAGLKEEHAATVADVLVHADARGLHSHGAMRTEYYAERISKGGTNCAPNFAFEETGPCTAIFDGDNAAGHVAAKLGMEHAIALAQRNGVAMVGVRRMGHSGALSYYVSMAAEKNLVALSVCQSDPMAVPFGGAEPYYGTNPIAFAAPSADGETILVDMATTVQAWGKILHARTLHEAIPEGWAVDARGRSTTDPDAVNALLPIAGPKGYGLALMVDVLAGVLLGLPFGKHVSSMYHDLSEGRNLGQMHWVIDPQRFTALPSFLENIATTRKELSAIKPAPGFNEVLCPGQPEAQRARQSAQQGVSIAEDIYDYLVSDVVHQNRFDHKSAFSK